MASRVLDLSSVLNGSYRGRRIGWSVDLNSNLAAASYDIINCNVLLANPENIGYGARFLELGIEPVVLEAGIVTPRFGNYAFTAVKTLTPRA